MEIFELSEFITKDNMGMITSLFIGTPLVLIFVQATKRLLDSLCKTLNKLPYVGKHIKKIKTYTYTFFVCLLYVIYILSSVFKYELNADFLFLLAINTAILFTCANGGFNYAFKGIEITKGKQENK